MIPFSLLLAAVAGATGAEDRQTRLERLLARLGPPARGPRVFSLADGTGPPGPRGDYTLDVEAARATGRWAARVLGPGWAALLRDWIAMPIADPPGDEGTLLHVVTEIEGETVDTQLGFPRSTTTDLAMAHARARVPGVHLPPGWGEAAADDRAWFAAWPWWTLQDETIRVVLEPWSLSCLSAEIDEATRDALAGDPPARLRAFQVESARRMVQDPVGTPQRAGAIFLGSAWIPSTWRGYELVEIQAWRRVPGPAARRALGLAETTVGPFPWRPHATVTLRTGQRAFLPLLHNTAPTPRIPGDPYGPAIEPAGTYWILHEAGVVPAPGWIADRRALVAPLVIRHGTTPGPPEGWKARLSQAFEGRRGAALSRALRAAGVDAVITVEDNRETAEIVELAP